jgi:hypothetical protein
METVIHKSGYFKRSGQAIIFIGDVTVIDEDGKEKTISGEHGYNDFEWGNHWNYEETPCKESVD